MQRTQSWQYKSTLTGRMAPNTLPLSEVSVSFNAATQASPSRRKPVRRLRSVKTDAQQTATIRHRILADGHTARGGETGAGAFYEAQEEAARRIAHRLHDESAQMLATIYLELADVARNCPDSTVQKVDLIVKHLDRVREQLRGLSHELSPPILDQFGLMPALQSLATGVKDRSGVNMVVSGNIASLPPLVGVVLYRVVQEALSNVVRHAKASKAEVRLSIEDKIVFCTVSDNGIGFKMSDQCQGSVNDINVGPAHGLGLAGIHERVAVLNGRCRISSCRNGGMKLKVEIPL